MQSAAGANLLDTTVSEDEERWEAWQARTEQFMLYSYKVRDFSPSALTRCMTKRPALALLLACTACFGLTVEEASKLATYWLL